MRNLWHRFQALNLFSKATVVVGLFLLLMIVLMLMYPRKAYVNVVSDYHNPRANNLDGVSEKRAYCVN